jgi:hypothetical protein
VIEKILTDLSEKLHLSSPPTKDEQGTYHFGINPALQIELKLLYPGLSFSSKIGHPPPDRKEEFYMYMMRANFLCQGTGGAVIGLCNQEKVLTLELSIPYEVNYLEFKDKLEDFVNYTEYWREEIKKFKELKSPF